MFTTTVACKLSKTAKEEKCRTTSELKRNFTPNITDDNHHSQSVVVSFIIC